MSKVHTHFWRFARAVESITGVSSMALTPILVVDAAVNALGIDIASIVLTTIRHGRVRRQRRYGSALIVY